MNNEALTLSVSEAVEYLNLRLGDAPLRIQGEVGGLAISQGKFAFFSIKDAECVIDCFAMAFRIPALAEGTEVIIEGLPRIYGRNGRFRITVARVWFKGEGALKAAQEILRTKLAKEGIFDLERKRPLPVFPECIGLITSKTAAAYGDFMKIASERWGGTVINFYDARVQGLDAVEDIIAGLSFMHRLPQAPEVIVVTRGGGSLEDLQVFNTETLVRAAYASRIPIVSAVGHERDSTLLDEVADCRASTPTNAAELVFPARHMVALTLSNRIRTIANYYDQTLALRRHELLRSASALFSIVDTHRRVLIQTLRRMHDHMTTSYTAITVLNARIVSYTKYTYSALSHRLASAQISLDAHIKLLHALHPIEVLKRGYSILRKGSHIITAANDVSTGEHLTAETASGTIALRVE